jgi:hypothetical protein
MVLVFLKYDIDAILGVGKLGYSMHMDMGALPEIWLMNDEATGSIYTIFFYM